MTSTLCSLVLALAAACLVVLVIRGGRGKSHSAAIAAAAASTLACGLACIALCVDAAGVVPDAALTLAALAAAATATQAVISWLLVRSNADVRWVAASGAALILFTLSSCLFCASYELMGEGAWWVERCLYRLILVGVIAAALVLNLRKPFLTVSPALMRGLIATAAVLVLFVAVLPLALGDGASVGFEVINLTPERAQTLHMPIAIALFIAGSSIAAARARDYDLCRADALLVLLAFIETEVALVAIGFLPEALLLMMCGGIAMAFATGSKKWLGAFGVATILLGTTTIAIEPALQDRIGVWLGLWSDPFGIGWVRGVDAIGTEVLTPAAGWERAYNEQALASGGALGCGLQSLPDMLRLANGDYLHLLAQAYGAVGVAAAAGLSLTALAVVVHTAWRSRGKVQARCFTSCVALTFALHALEPLLEFVGLLPAMDVCSPFSAQACSGRVDLALLFVTMLLCKMHEKDFEITPPEQAQASAVQHEL